MYKNTRWILPRLKLTMIQEKKEEKKQLFRMTKQT